MLDGISTSSKRSISDMNIFASTNISDISIFNINNLNIGICIDICSIFTIQ